MINFVKLKHLRPTGQMSATVFGHFRHGISYLLVERGGQFCINQFSEIIGSMFARWLAVGGLVSGWRNTYFVYTDIHKLKILFLCCVMTFIDFNRPFLDFNLVFYVKSLKLLVFYRLIHFLTFTYVLRVEKKGFFYFVYGSQTWFYLRYGLLFQFYLIFW